MKELRVCFVGLGSIAKRHIKNLVRICEEDGIIISIDALRRENMRGEDLVYKSIQNIYTSVEDMTQIYDAIFITNPTEYHMDVLTKITPYGKNFFIEKPVASLNQLEQAENYVQKEESIYYVACPLRYNAVIQYIKNNIRKDDVISIRSISSSYLPDWRPGQDYRQTYSAQKKLGGGVSTDLIHEWDYLTYLFGMPQKVNYMYGKKSALEIDSEDYAIYLAEYSDKIVELHLDYFGRKTIREIVLITQEDTIVGDILNNNIVFLKSGEKVEFHEERDDYQIRELRHFINIIDGEKQDNSGLDHAISVLRLTQGEIR